MLKHLPNALTLTRLLLAPVVAWLFWTALDLPSRGGMIALEPLMQDIANYLTASAVLFVIAALTDFFDGIAARAFNAHSKFGRIIDPIADKALVGLPLIVIALAIWQGGHPAWPLIAFATAVIVVRDTGMTVVRLSAPDGEGAPVSSLAKLKTALELIVVGSVLVVTAIGAQIQANNTAEPFLMPYAGEMTLAWTGLLVITAALSAWTGWQYLRPKR